MSFDCEDNWDRSKLSLRVADGGELVAIFENAIVY